MSTESLPGAIWTEDESAARPASAFTQPAPSPTALYPDQALYPSETLYPAA